MEARQAPPPLSVVSQPDLAPSGMAQIAPAPGSGPRRWPPRRLAAVEALWGAGFTGPCGGPETLRLAKPMALNSNASLLLLGGGTGGPAETIAGTLGAWVASFEADADLADVAERHLTNHPAARRVQIATWDRANPAFAPRSANHALSLEAVRGAAMDPVLEGLCAALRPHGHIVLTELVTATEVPDSDREFAAWCRLEDRLPNLPRMDDITATLTRLRFDVRVVEDMSDRHVSATLAGWRAAVKSMETGPRPDTGDVAAFVTEAELWLLRVRLMRRFGFRLVRWHAIGTA
jgi:hypothetical protein